MNKKQNAAEDNVSSNKLQASFSKIRLVANSNLKALCLKHLNVINGTKCQKMRSLFSVFLGYVLPHAMECIVNVIVP